MKPGYKLNPLVSTCIPCRRLHVSYFGDKVVVTVTCIRLVSASKTLLRTCIRLHVSDGYKLLAWDTCIRLHIWCKRGFNTCRRWQGIQVDTTCIRATCIRCKRDIMLSTNCTKVISNIINEKQQKCTNIGLLKFNEPTETNNREYN